MTRKSIDPTNILNIPWLESRIVTKRNDDLQKCISLDGRSKNGAKIHIEGETPTDFVAKLLNIKGIDTGAALRAAFNFEDRFHGASDPKSQAYIRHTFSQSIKDEMKEKSQWVIDQVAWQLRDSQGITISSTDGSHYDTLAIEDYRWYTLDYALRRDEFDYIKVKTNPGNYMRKRVEFILIEWPVTNTEWAMSLCDLSTDALNTIALSIDDFITQMDNFLQNLPDTDREDLSLFTQNMKVQQHSANNYTISYSKSMWQETISTRHGDHITYGIGERREAIIRTGGWEKRTKSPQ